MLNDTKILIQNQDFIRTWLERINETDEAVINETVTLMRTNKEYRKFILDYVKGQNETR